MTCSSVYSCELIHGYPKAQRYFEERKPVRSKRWAVNQRPLYTSRYKCYSIERWEDGDYYDMVLYGAAMARYYRPDPDTGEYTVLLRGRGSHTSWAYLHHACGFATWYMPLKTTAEEEVLVPLNTRPDRYKGEAQVPAGWSAKLVFDKKDRLIVEKSDHIPVHVSRSTPEEKAIRAATLAKLEGFLDLMMLRLPSFHERSLVSIGRHHVFGSGFKTHRYREDPRVNCMVAEIKSLAAGGEVSESTLPALLEFAEEHYNTMLSKSVPHYEIPRGWGDTSGAHLPAITPARFRESLKAALVRRSPLSYRTGVKELPKFPKRLPRKYFSL